MNAIQRYELIRPILKGEKTTKQVSEEKDVPLSNIYRYFERLREGSGNMESLAGKSHAIRSHPKGFTQQDKDKVIQYKIRYPHLSSRQIAKALAQEGILQIHRNQSGCIGETPQESTSRMLAPFSIPV